MKPCEEGKVCVYEIFDYTLNEIVCNIGDNCPYIKPGGKKRYEKDMIKAIEIRYGTRKPKIFDIEL